MKLFYLALALVAACSVDDDNMTSSRCLGGYRLQGSECVPADRLKIQLSVLDDEKAGRVWAAQGPSACFDAVARRPRPRTRLGSDGPCFAIDPGDPGGASPGEDRAADTGTVVIRGGHPEVMTFSPSLRACLSYDDPLDFVVVFEVGSTLEISGSGGADFPAFDVRLAAPSDVSIDLTEVRPNQPIPIRWQGEDSNRTVQLFVILQPGGQILCEVPDSGSFTIPASMWQWIPTPLDYGSVSVQRRRLAHLEPASTRNVIEVQLQTTGHRAVQLAQ